MDTISETLKKALAESGLSHKGIERDAGVNRNSLARFASGRTSLSLVQADELARHLGYVLVHESQVQRSRKEG
ncbi:MAG: helix-turn-helix transcriptional regulator [Candidatus Hydrogenedentes bacterium]|nr:helix-turn-helix transcriptional regulator [Candidatus Hydrogenedentota bacterium]